jgi:TonB family protein
MKPLGFLVSLLVHLLFLLLLMRVQFPVPEGAMALQVIQIVPMSPPRPAPPLVYVRPFVLRGGARGSASGGIPGKKTVPLAGSRQARQAAAPPGRVSRAVVPAATGEKETSVLPQGERLAVKEERPRFAVDMGRISRELREKLASGQAASGPRIGDEAQEGLPFGDLPRSGSGAGGNIPSGGDGTTRHALGGSAFFDSRGYDITPWAKRVVYRIKTNWIFPAVSGFGLKGIVGIYVLIERDGTIGSVYIRRASGIRPFDQAAFNAIELSAPLPPLPDDFPRENLPAYLLFYYN